MWFSWGWSGNLLAVSLAIGTTYTRPAGGSGSVCSQDFDNFVKCGLLKCQSTVGLSTGFDGGRGLSSSWSGTACLVLIQASRQINLTLTTAAWLLISSITCSPISEINSSRDRANCANSVLKLTKPWTLSPNPNLCYLRIGRLNLKKLSSCKFNAQGPIM